MEILQLVLRIIFVLSAVVMVFFILLQEGKGGGLTGLGGTKAAGVEGVTNPIRRATTVMACIFFGLAIVLGILARTPGSLIEAGTLDKSTVTGGMNEKKTPAVTEREPALRPTPPAENTGKQGAPKENAPKENAPQDNRPKEKAPKPAEPKADQKP